ncbi:MAG: methanogen output domain 1-containing protein, partial [Burkholderiaceae bacterium]
MEQFGYSTNNEASKAAVIEADNCVFHNLALQNTAICQFDLALLSTFTDSKVDHQECMAKNGNVCRFKFLANKEH